MDEVMRHISDASKCYVLNVKHAFPVVANEMTAYVTDATNRCCGNVGVSLPFTTSSRQQQLISNEWRYRKTMNDV